MTKNVKNTTSNKKEKIEEKKIKNNEENLEKNIEENNENIDNEENLEKEFDKNDDSCNDRLVKLQADFENFKARTQREKSDMIFFLKQEILLKILPRLDDLDRIIKNTNDDLKNTPLYEGIIAIQKNILSDLNKMGVKAFDSCGNEIDPNKHEVMTTIPGKKEGIICDEFEKGYELDGRVLRHAKVVVGAGE